MMPSSDPRRLLFVVTEDWFFASHFLPMAVAARAAGLEPVVVTRVRDHAAVIEAAGVRIVPFDVERREIGAMRLVASVLRMRRIMRRERPVIVHCISMRSILVGGLAARLAGVRRSVFALTGLGYLGARADTKGRLARRAVAVLVKALLAPSGNRLLLENTDDARLVGLRHDFARLTIVGGAGVDPDALPVAPLPARPPLKVAIVARMVWSKGIDIAVDAVRLARAEGVDVALSLYGAADPSNPRSYSADVLRAWSSQDGVEWHGRTEDVAAVWATHHVACLPSRGGEGLPRMLLEAAACGRAIVTTDVPGCRDFVREGEDGLVLPVDDPRALADAFAALARDPERVARMGASAHERVLDGYTVGDVERAVVELYREMLASQ